MSAEYTYEIIGGLFCYFKNGVLHREAGPSVFFATDIHLYFELEDKDLYNKVEEKPGESSWRKSFLYLISYSEQNTPAYYLNGEPYDKDAWISAMEKQELYEQLDNELVSIPNCHKKSKV